ncbi:MAG: hypothetical protein AAGM38_14980 [Pseudomonadota bacterium]
MSAETPRAPRPLAEYGLPDAVAAQLKGLRLAPDAPLLAVDADEVLLDFAAHLGRWMEGEGWRMSLTEYRLEGAIRRIEDGRAAERAEVGALITRFFAAEAGRQEVAPGAAEALAALRREMGAQIIVLTNIPQAQAETRRRLLAANGIDYPLVANEGGKGRALRWLWDRTRGAMAFVDDADGQLGSARSHAPGVFRLHFVAGEALRRITGAAANAEAAAASWPEARAILAARFAARP